MKTTMKAPLSSDRTAGSAWVEGSLLSVRVAALPHAQVPHGMEYRCPCC